MNNTQQKRIVVVLGMHRSGTSVITRGLEVIGINLGDHLLSPAADNRKGFWEDVDINALNIDLLRALGHDWHTLTPVLPEEMATPAVGEFKLRAVEILRNKLSTTNCFGLKDPRIPRLLPFWQDVFAHLKVRVSYVIACRNPMSVARSLATRNGFDLEKSYYLWLEHMLKSLVQTANQPRIVVDYDYLIEDPPGQLQRTAQSLGLVFDPESPEFAEYRTQFLEGSLRHTRYRMEDLHLDKAVPPNVVELYEVLIKLAADTVEFDHREVVSPLRRINAQFCENYPALHYLQICDERASVFAQQVAERDARLADLNEAVRERDERVTAFAQQVAERDVQLNGFTQAVAERDALRDMLAEVFASRSWRMTSPVRLIGRRLRQTKNAALNASRFLKQGGWVGSLRKSVRIIRREGVTGIRLRLSRGPVSVLPAALAHNITVTGVDSAHSEVGIQALRQSLRDNHGRLIVVFPVITWDFRWQRPQHIVSRLRDHGYSVWYLAMSLMAQGRRLRGDKDAIAEARFNELDRHINQIWLSSRKQLNIYTDQLIGDDLHNITVGLRALISELRPKSIKYLVQFPGWWPAVEALQKQLGGNVIFDCMDDHGGFSSNTKQAIATEDALLKSADLVITSSDLLERKAKQVSSNVIQIKNGTEFEHFANSRRNGELEHLAGRPVIGYYGAISDWFDMELVAYCAQRFPDWNFVLIGATLGADLKFVEGLTNVHFLGEKPYKDLPGYLGYFDVCIIPFKIIPLTLATNPVKFYEYLSAGKPVVSVELPELMMYKDDCYLAHSGDEFAVLLERAYGERDDETKIERRIKLASENSWDSRVSNILESIR